MEPLLTTPATPLPVAVAADADRPCRGDAPLTVLAGGDVGPDRNLREHAGDGIVARHQILGLDLARTNLDARRVELHRDISGLQATGERTDAETLIVRRHDVFGI